jgi:lipoprotein-anchoring transpeptidase ErfK/SrfK
MSDTLSDTLTTTEADRSERAAFTLRAVSRRDPTPELALVRVSGRFEGPARISPYLLWANGPTSVPMIPPLSSAGEGEDWSAEFAIASSRLDAVDTELLLLLPDGAMVELPAPQSHDDVRESVAEPADVRPPAPDASAEPIAPPAPEPEGEREGDRRAPRTDAPATPRRRGSAAGAARWLVTAAALMIGGWSAAYALQNVGGDASPPAVARSADAAAGSPPRGDEAAPPTPEQAVAATPKGTRLVARAVRRRILLYPSPSATRSRAFLRNPTAMGAPAVFLVQAASGNRFKVHLPIRPNGSTAWIRATDVRVALVRYRVDVDLASHRLTVWRGDRRLRVSRIGVGRSLTPTPPGVYYITALLKQPNPTGMYGPYAFALSGHSTVLDEFAGGNGRIGIHGTNQPSGIGSDVSHGCIRVPNSVIRRLARQLPLGTPVHIAH